MNRFIKNIILICVLTCMYLIGFSQQQQHHVHQCTISADPYPKSKTQPDGEQITIKMFGNRQSHYIETIDGYTITKDRKDGFYKYMTAGKDGELFLTDIVVRNVDNRSQKERNFLIRTPKKLRVTGKALKEKQALQQSLHKNASSSSIGDFPSFGVRKALMLLIDFPDQPATYTVNDFDRMLNEDGYNVNGQTGSFRDYYQDISYGNLTVNSDVEGWYRAANNKAFYGAEVLGEDGNVSAKDVNVYGLVVEAIEAAQANNVDFSQYDNDNDGVVDVVMIIHSGQGQQSSGEGDDIWSHKSSLGAANFNGVLIEQYIIQYETYDESGNITIANIGTLCHEFGHALGLPDLYGNSTVPGIGLWGLMGSGSWNNRGRTPTHLCAWSKTQLGWITPTVITSPTPISNMPTIDISPTCYRLNTANTTEYFLISARQQSGWDSGIGGGVAIWHIDDTQPGNHRSTERPQVELENIYGITNKTIFNANTTPNSRTYEGYDSGNCVSNISVAGTAPNLKASFDIDCAYGGAQYCLVENMDISNELIHISNVTFAGINNSSSYSGYTNYVYNVPATVSISGTHLLSISKPNDAVFNIECFWKVWIDYNQDGIFDDNSELVLNRVNEANSLITENVIIPANALPGATRMRVALKLSEVGAVAPLPCEEGDYGIGELEDYTVIICSADADQDGVCAADDCDDNNPAIPAPLNADCDDDNPNTIYDFMLDECTCIGFYEDFCVPFFDLSGTINSAIYFVQDYIRSDGQVAADGTVIFEAGNFVELLPGFDAKADIGSRFDAKINDECPANKQETDEEQIAIRNYPNPFTGQTTIEFELSKDTPVSLFVSDAMGRRIEVLLDSETKTKGTHSVNFDGGNYPTGMYYYTIQAGEYTGTHKMILIK